MELDFLPEVVVAGDDRILLCQVLTFLSEWTQWTTKTGAHSNEMAWKQDHSVIENTPSHNGTVHWSNITQPLFLLSLAWPSPPVQPRDRTSDAPSQCEDSVQGTCTWGSNGGTHRCRQWRLLLVSVLLRTGRRGHISMLTSPAGRWVCRWCSSVSGSWFGGWHSLREPRPGSEWQSGSPAAAVPALPSTLSVDWTEHSPFGEGSEVSNLVQKWASQKV